MSFGVISLVVGILVILGVVAFMLSAIKEETFERNRVIGLKTSSTLASDEAWKAGHEAAVPILRASMVVGGVGALVTIVAGVMAGSLSMLGFWVGMIALIVHMAFLIAATVRANAVAKEF